MGGACQTSDDREWWAVPTLRITSDDREWWAVPTLRMFAGR
ncbi:MAG: hypothetical protein AB4352_17575 [Hormoscilla sp.]